MSRAKRVPAMAGLKAAGCWAGGLSDYAGLERLLVAGLLELKADCVPGQKGCLVVIEPEG